MKFFYCQSYQAFNLALSMNLEEEITIITPSANIVNACIFLNVKHIYHEAFSPIKMIKNKHKVEKEISRLLKIINNNEFHFSHTQFAVFCFYLVKRLVDNRGNVVFHNFEFIYEKISSFFEILKNLYIFLLYSILKIKYKIPLELRNAGKDILVISFRGEYITNLIKQVVDDGHDYYDITLKLFKTITLEIKEIKYLFIAQTFKAESLFDSAKINIVLPVINDPNVMVKMHPKLGKIYELEKCSKLPDYLPVEFFFNKVKGCVISIHSASLITATKFENIKVISLLTLVGQKNTFVDKAKMDLINKSGNKILFPENIHELKRMMNE